MCLEQWASYSFTGFFWKADATCRWKMEKTLTFAVEMPARKVRVNGAERQRCGWCACQGLRCALVVRPGEEYQIWRMCCLSVWLSSLQCPLLLLTCLFFLASNHHQFFFRTFLNVILPKTLKVFSNQYHRRNKKIDAKLRQGRATDFSRCHGNTDFVLSGS